MHLYSVCRKHRIAIPSLVPVWLTILGNDSKTSVFRIRFLERSFSPPLSHPNHPSHSRETFHVYFPLWPENSYPPPFPFPVARSDFVADYAAAPRKATEDLSIIDHRKRMLQSFLNRLVQHPILRRDHVVHRFLTGDASWVRDLDCFPLTFISIPFYSIASLSSILILRTKSSILHQFPFSPKIY